MEYFFLFAYWVFSIVVMKGYHKEEDSLWFSLFGGTLFAPITFPILMGMSIRKIMDKP